MLVLLELFLRRLSAIQSEAETAKVPGEAAKALGFGAPT